MMHLIILTMLIRKKMKKITKGKNFDNYKNSILLYSYFHNKENHELVIQFIYNHAYDLLNELKFLPYDFYDKFLTAYAVYYYSIIAQNEELWLKSLFPLCNTGYLYNFSFKRFYIGLL